MKKHLLISTSLVVLALTACSSTDKQPPVTDQQPIVNQQPIDQQPITTQPVTQDPVQQPVAVANSLCNANEQVLFNCQIAGKASIVSVCGSSNLSKSAGYLQYRYGTSSKLDLEFPANQSTSKSDFMFDGRNISFNRGNIKYQVYTQGSAGIQTFWATAPNRNKTYPCDGASVTNQLQKLNGVLN